jgi:hypothetical protein
VELLLLVKDGVFCVFLSLPLSVCVSFCIVCNSSGTVCVCKQIHVIMVGLGLYTPGLKNTYIILRMKVSVFQTVDFLVSIYEIIYNWEIFISCSNKKNATLKQKVMIS